MNNAIKCNNGTFVGKETDELIIWKGIPYATQPVGKLRWKKALPAEQYKAVLPLLGYYQFMDHYFTPHYLLDIIAACE